MNKILFYLLFGFYCIKNILCDEDQQITIPKSQVSCNFNNDNCDWYTNSYVDETGIMTKHWTRKNWGTPSRNTGPTNGHICPIENPLFGRFCIKSETTNNYYLYTEATGQFNKIFDLRLRNPIIANSTKCGLIFWTSMYGINMGILNLQIKYNNTNIWKTIWSHSGNIGSPKWIQNTIFFENSTKYFNMRFRGITGNSYRSDMAIDDIYFGCDLVLEKPIIEPSKKEHYNLIEINMKSSLGIIKYTLDGSNPKISNTSQIYTDKIKIYKSGKNGVINENLNCWNKCNFKQGPCKWCGSGMCCRYGWTDFSNGCSGNIGKPGIYHHICNKNPYRKLKKLVMILN